MTAARIVVCRRCVNAERVWRLFEGIRLEPDSRSNITFDRDADHDHHPADHDCRLVSCHGC